MRVPRIPPFLLFVAAAAGQHALARSRRVTPASAVAAAPLGAAAGWLGVGSLREFLRWRTSVNPHDVSAPSVLVVTGPNRVTRNPMYVALAALLGAHAIVRRSVAAAGPAAAFVVLIDRSQIPAEEAALHAAFGADFEQYRASVPRWVGPVRRQNEVRR